jgi:hypothetical protein
LPSTWHPILQSQTSEGNVEKTKFSQARPMTTWCVLVAALVAIVIAIGVAMFYMPGRGAPEEKRSTTPASQQ